ncbi:predicted protein [Uncinocarpus reesii 1704]|uniref:Uncharacterized protein n=1 Tax=Uncinocarpus reesii (strain UAMH 1704) TaxID=336963 RepID=C4K0A5_UNCRE|nr:uncharacterized protein UREG_07919 [Uncinocarpus reesii 1704]EEP83054.1 predicted protein [Uncinocarpus reesii 1704]
MAPTGNNKPYFVWEEELIESLKMSESSWEDTLARFNNSVAPDRQRTLGGLKAKFTQIQQTRNAATESDVVEVSHSMGFIILVLTCIYIEADINSDTTLESTREGTPEEPPLDASGTETDDSPVNASCEWTTDGLDAALSEPTDSDALDQNIRLPSTEVIFKYDVFRPSGEFNEDFYLQVVEDAAGGVQAMRLSNASVI